MILKRMAVGSLLLMLSAGVALAARGDGFHGAHHLLKAGGSPERMLEHIERVLDLDDARKQSLTNVVTAAAPQFEALRERAKENVEALRALDVDDADYATRLQNLATIAGELATQAVLLHGRLRADLSAELTDEQRVELAAALTERRERFREHRHARHRDHDRN